MLQAIHIRKQFQRSGEVLRDVSFTLGDGEFLSVIGPSGAGKTTLFRILNGTELCSGGEVLYGGTHFEAARGREKRALQQGIGTIYQDFCLVENLSAIQNVLNACLPDMSLAASLLGAFGRERSEQAAAILREVGLADKLEEVKTVCWCGRKATFNARVQNGHIVREGEQIMMGGNSAYVSLCRRHWKDGNLGSFCNLNLED